MGDPEKSTLQAANGSDQAQPPPYDAGQKFVSVNPQTAEVFVVPENQSELVTVKEDNGCLPDTDEWKWYDWMLAILVGIVIVPLLVACCIFFGICIYWVPEKN